MKRLVETDRWKDSWFIQLHPNAKLLLSYLYDNCDESGFVDLNYSLWSTQLKMEKEFIVTSLKALKSALLSDTKKKLFIIDFLKHQKKLPLIKGTEEVDWIISKLESNLSKFNDAPEIADILSKVEDPSRSTRAIPKRFVEPTYENFKKYYLSQKTVDESEIRSLFDHYLSCGWKVGNKAMKDWEAAIRTSIQRNNKKNSRTNIHTGENKTNGNSRTETTLGVIDAIKNNKQNMQTHG